MFPFAFLYHLKTVDKMRKLLFLVLLSPLALAAQVAQYGYFSMSSVLDSIPEYRTAQDDYNALLVRCDAEVAHSEEELTRCYVAFLDGQNNFPEPILRKRQKELQDLVDRSVVLRDQLKEWLSQAHDSLFAPVNKRVDEAVARVCIVRDLAYAIDADNSSYRFINPKFGCDITALVLQEVFNPGSVKPLEQPVAAEEAVTDERSIAAEEDTTPVVDTAGEAVENSTPAEIVIE